MKFIFKHFKVFCLTILIILNIFIFFIIYSNHSNILKIVFLNIGQGDSIFIESPVGNQVLIDGGMNSRVLEALGREVPFYDRSIDVVITTHPDSDHIGGLPVVLDKYNVKNYFDNGMENDTALSKELDKKVSDMNIPYLKIERGMMLDIGGGAYLRILSPTDGYGISDTNMNSIIAKLYFGSNSVMLTGDAPTEIENDLVKKYGSDLKSDILKVAHHGSKNSLSEAFISAVSPDISVISVNKDNRYGHPHIEILDFLKEIGSKILLTFEKGNIVLESDGQNFELN